MYVVEFFENSFLQSQERRVCFQYQYLFSVKHKIECMQYVTLSFQTAK